VTFFVLGACRWPISNQTHWFLHICKYYAFSNAYAYSVDDFRGRCGWWHVCLLPVDCSIKSQWMIDRSLCRQCRVYSTIAVFYNPLLFDCSLFVFLGAHSAKCIFILLRRFYQYHPRRTDVVFVICQYFKTFCSCVHSVYQHWTCVYYCCGEFYWYLSTVYGRLLYYRSPVVSFRCVFSSWRLLLADCNTSRVLTQGTTIQRSRPVHTGRTYGHAPCHVPVLRGLLYFT